jgi:methyl-accepting chemotaxis protein
MRIWRTTAQSYLNGINVDLDIEKATNPQKCGVGIALATLLQANPSIQSVHEFKVVHDFHIKQHQLVEEVLVIIGDGQTTPTEIELRERDALLDAFIKTTEKLDNALADLNTVLT